MVNSRVHQGMATPQPFPQPSGLFANTVNNFSNAQVQPYFPRPIKREVVEAVNNGSNYGTSNGNTYGATMVMQENTTNGGAYMSKMQSKVIVQKDGSAYEQMETRQCSTPFGDNQMNMNSQMDPARHHKMLYEMKQLMSSRNSLSQGSNSDGPTSPQLLSPNSSHSNSSFSPPAHYMPNLVNQVPNSPSPVSPQSGSRILCCKICNYSTKDPWHLEKHLLAHTKGSKTCRFCSKAFDRPSDLARHEERHWMKTPDDNQHASPMLSPSSTRSISPIKFPSNPLPAPPVPAMLAAKPAGFNPTGPKPTGFNPTGPKPTGFNPTGPKPTGLNPAGPKPAGPRPAGINPSGAKPVKFFSCDICVSKFISMENLKVHKDKEHGMFCVRLDLYTANFLYQTHIIKGEVTGKNEISLTFESPSISEMTDAEEPVPNVSSITDITSILKTPNAKLNYSKHALVKKGEEIWIKDKMKALKTSSTSEDNSGSSCGPIQDTRIIPSKFPASHHPRQVRPVEAIFRCTKCNYATNVRANWSEHQRAHQGRFVCKICGKAFLKTSDLTRHWVGHETIPGGQGIICDSCPFTCMDKHVMEAHMKGHYLVTARPSRQIANQQLPSPIATQVKIEGMKQKYFDNIPSQQMQQNVSRLSDAGVSFMLFMLINRFPRL